MIKPLEASFAPAFTCIAGAVIKASNLLIGGNTALFWAISAQNGAAAGSARGPDIFYAGPEQA